MEQLQQVIEFLKTWRFWISVGVAAVLASLISYFGTPQVAEKFNARKGQLDGAYQGVSRFAVGQHPNPTWKQDVATKEQEASSKVAEIQTQIYEEQASRMTWPDAVAEAFNKRPFNAGLDDERGTLLFAYFRAFDGEYRKLLQTVEPIEVTEKGEVVGKVVVPESALDRPNWSSPPPSTDAWLAQEQMWIQRAVLESIAELNKSAKNWYEAPIREVVKISIGEEGVDSERIAANNGDVKLQELVSAVAIPGSVAPTPTTTASGDGLNPTRYLQVTPDFREIPAMIRVLGDQRKLPEILAAFAGIEFGFVINEVSWTVPATKVEVPKEIQEYSDTVPGSARDVIDNTIEITVYGDVRLYEMAPEQKQKYEQELQASGQPAVPM